MATPSPAEIERRTQAALTKLREQNAVKGPPARELDEPTRRRVSEGVLRYHSRRVAADPDASPVKRARYERGLSLKAVAARAGICLNAAWAAEVRPEKATWRTKVAISRALKTPTRVLFPGYDKR